METLRAAPARILALTAVVAGAYYGAAKLGLELAFEHGNVTAIWPPTGIALAAVVLGGYRLLPGVALGAFLANVGTDIPLLTTLGITTGNTLEALVGAALLRRVGFRPELDRLRDVFALVALAGMLSTAVAATIGNLSLVAGDEIEWGDFPSLWRVWWLGDMGGDLLAAPLLLVAGSGSLRLPGRRRALEGVLMIVATIAVSELVFRFEDARTYLIFPPLVWAALRFGAAGAALTSLIGVGFAVWFTDNGMGPFLRASPDAQLLNAQLYMGIAAITALSLAAITTERARAQAAAQYRFMEQRRIARTLQQSLLPPALPTIQGAGVAGRFSPAAESRGIGGDFYDVFEVGGGRFALVMGDVCGKGPAAAAATALARYTLRAVAVEAPTPADALLRLNQIMLRQAEETGFITILLVFIRTDSRGAAVEIASGGHPLPLAVRRDGSVEQLGASGTIIGAFPKPDLADSHAELGTGDTLVLYTDGVVEAGPPGRALGLASLTGLLERHGGDEPDVLARRLEDAALMAQGGPARDDMAILVVRVAGAPAVPRSHAPRWSSGLSVR